MLSLIHIWYTEEERQLLRDIAQLKGTLQRLNNYFPVLATTEIYTLSLHDALPISLFV